MRAYLIQIDAWDGSTATPVRLASHNDERLCHLDGKTWWPAIASLPTLRYDFFDGAFEAGSITSPSGEMSVSFSAIPSLPALSLHDTRIRIWRGELGDAWDGFSLIFDGRVQEQPATTEGIASIRFGVDDSWLDQPLLATYGGTGGADGPEDLKGQAIPLALGAPRFAPATLIDAVDNIYQISGYGAINTVEMAFERLNRFGSPMGNAANFASLKAATIAPGRWATCLAGGYVRFGAPPDGLLSFHVQGDAVGGWSQLPGDIIARIATIGGGVGKFSTADVTALNAARPWNLSIMVTAQTTARELIQRIATSVNAVAFVDWLGQLRLAPIGIGAPSLTLASDGSSLPPVASVEQVAIAAPYWKIAQGAAVTWQVHGLSDIAFNSPLNPRGPYSPTEEYREGDMVTLPDGSQWLFVGATPATGSAPSDTNPNWFRLADNITAGNITYEDGTPVEDLKPAEAGATNGASPEEKEKLDDLEADTAQALIDIAAAQSSITSLQTQGAAMQAALTTAQNDIIAQGAEITAQGAEITAQGAEITAQGAEITAQGAAILANANDIATVQSTVASQGAAITTLQQTATDLTGSIATLTTTVTASMQGSDNLLTNTDFANGSAGYTSATGNGIDAITFDWDASSALKPSGENCLLISQASGTSAGWAEYRQSVSVEVGKYYEVSTWAAGQRCQVGIRTRFYDAAGNALGNEGGTAWTPGAGGLSLDSYIRQATSTVAMAGAATLRITLRKTGTTSGSSSWARFLRPQVVESFAGAPSPRAFSHGNAKASVVQNATAISTLDGQYASLSSTVSTQGASITANATAITTLQGSVSTLSTTVSTQGGQITTLQSSVTTLQGSVSTLQTTVSTQGSSISSLQTAMTSVQGSMATLTMQVLAGSANALLNGGPDNGTADWTAGGGGSLTTGVSTNGRGNYFRLTGTASPSVSATRVRVTAGNPITFAVNTQLSGPSGTQSRLILIWEGASGDGYPETGRSYGAYQPIHNFDDNGTRRIASAATGVAPTGTQWVRCAIATYSGGTGTVTLDFQQAKAEKSDAPTVYSAEASVSQTFTAISTLDGQYATLSSTVSTQGSSITSLQSSVTTLQGTTATLTTTLTASMGGTSNMLTNTTFDNGRDGWTTASGSGIDGIQYLFNGTAGYSPENENCLVINQTTGTSSGWAEYRQSVPVEAGKYYELSTWAAGQRCQVSIRSRFFDSAGNALGSEGGFTWTPGAGGLALDSYIRQAVVLDAPVGAATLRISLRKNATNSGSSNSWARFLRPQIVETFSGAPSPRTFTHGSNKASVVANASALSTLTTQYADLSSTVSTQGVTVSQHSTAITTINGNITTLFGQYVLNIDVNGRVVGMKLANNGSATSIKFRSDLVTFEGSSSSGQRTEYSGGNWRVYDSAGTLRVRMGVW